MVNAIIVGFKFSEVHLEALTIVLGQNVSVINRESGTNVDHICWHGGMHTMKRSKGKLQNNMNSMNPLIYMLYVYFICIVKHLENFHSLLLLYILDFYKHEYFCN